MCPQSVMLNRTTFKRRPVESVISTRHGPLSDSRSWMELKEEPAGRLEGQPLFVAEFIPVEPVVVDDGLLRHRIKVRKAKHLSDGCGKDHARVQRGVIPYAFTRHSPGQGESLLALGRRRP